MPRASWNYIGAGGYVPSDPNAAAYVAAVRGSGSVVSTGEAMALDTLTLGLKSAGLWAVARRINPMIGSALAGVGQILRATVGLPTDTLNNYAGGDWNPADGLQGNATSTFIDTGWSINFSDSTGFYGVCYRGGLPAGTRYMLGVNTGAGAAVTLSSTTAPAFVGQVGGAPIVQNGIFLNPSILSVNRVSLTDVTLYKDNAIEASSATLASPVNPTQNLVLGALVSAGGGKSGHLGAGERLGGYMFFNGLNNAQRGDLQTLWTAFNAAIGR